MRLLARILVAAAVAALPASIALLSCGTDAVGVDACRKIETARCDVAPACTPGFDVNRCNLFYRDECLNGIADTTPDADPSAAAPACVQAIDQVAACIDSGAPGCLAGLVVADAGCSTWDTKQSLGCNLILNCPQNLAACYFLAPASSSDAGTVADAATPPSDAGDGGDAASPPSDAGDGGDGG